MKNKYIYIIALLLTILICLSIEIRHQTDLQHISILTAENAELKQDITWLQYTNDQRATTIELLTNALKDTQETSEAQPSKVPEAQKTNRSADRPRYALTEAERDLVERVVMAESGGESYKGQMLVCQCILNACEIDGICPAKVVKKYVYAKARPEPSDSVKRAVSAVFDKGEQVTDEKVIYFYAPGIVKSEFHESQTFCIEVGGHRFFKEKEG